MLDHRSEQIGNDLRLSPAGALPSGDRQRTHQKQSRMPLAIYRPGTSNQQQEQDRELGLLTIRRRVQDLGKTLCEDDREVRVGPIRLIDGSTAVVFDHGMSQSASRFQDAPRASSGADGISQIPHAQTLHPRCDKRRLSPLQCRNETGE